jgi:hypothetical protein
MDYRGLISAFLLDIHASPSFSNPKPQDGGFIAAVGVWRSKEHDWAFYNYGI